MTCPHCHEVLVRGWHLSSIVYGTTAGITAAVLLTHLIGLWP